MAERVHPEPSPSPPPPPPPPEKPKIPPAAPLKPSPPPSSFVIQLPKDQIYRIPPPENAYRFDFYTRRAAKCRRSRCRRCRRCLFFSILSLSLLLISLSATIGFLYLIYRPKLPSFSIKSLSVRTINLSSAAVSPQFNLNIQSENPNNKNGIYYENGGSVAVDFSGEVLCRGDWATFYQGKRNVTVVETALEGSGIRLSDAVRGRLTAAVNRKEVPLGINAELPMRMRFGAVKIWTVTVKLRCDVTVDELTADSRIRKQECRVKVAVF